MRNNVLNVRLGLKRIKVAITSSAENASTISGGAVYSLIRMANQPGLLIETSTLLFEYLHSTTTLGILKYRVKMISFALE